MGKTLFPFGWQAGGRQLKRSPEHCGERTTDAVLRKGALFQRDTKSAFLVFQLERAFIRTGLGSPEEAVVRLVLVKIVARDRTSRVDGLRVSCDRPRGIDCSKAAAIGAHETVIYIRPIGIGSCAPAHRVNGISLRTLTGGPARARVI
jgi:hypothetical protein